MPVLGPAGLADPAALPVELAEDGLALEAGQDFQRLGAALRGAQALDRGLAWHLANRREEGEALADQVGRVEAEANFAGHHHRVRAHARARLGRAVEPF